MQWEERECGVRKKCAVGGARVWCEEEGCSGRRECGVSRKGTARGECGVRRKNAVGGESVV